MKAVNSYICPKLLKPNLFFRGSIKYAHPPAVTVASPGFAFIFANLLINDLEQVRSCTVYFKPGMLNSSPQAPPPPTAQVFRMSLLQHRWLNQRLRPF
ncbi:hypothetical protein FKM82_028086 [Ascaphus truei]